MRGLVLAAVAGLALAAGEVRADTTLKLVEVITSPPRTEFLKGQLAKFEQANPGRQGRDRPRCPGARPSRSSRPWSRAANIPDVVEMPDRWLALYANNGQLENLKPWIDKWDDDR